MNAFSMSPQGTTSLGRIGLQYLPEILFPLPPVVPEPPPTIDQMVASAKSRLKVFIDSECHWLSTQIHNDFVNLYFNTLDCSNGNYFVKMRPDGTIAGFGVRQPRRR